MFPLSINTYIIGALLLVSTIAVTYGRYEHIQYASLQREVAAAAKVQEAHNEAVVKQQDIITKGIKNDYESKLAAVRNFYSSGVQYASSRTMPSISAAPKGTDAETAYPILAGQCAETTAQLTSLQDWINQQVGIK
jgi:hypothetical protein